MALCSLTKAWNGASSLVVPPRRRWNSRLQRIACSVPVQWRRRLKLATRALGVLCVAGAVMLATIGRGDDAAGVDSGSGDASGSEVVKVCFTCFPATTSCAASDWVSTGDVEADVVEAWVKGCMGHCFELVSHARRGRVFGRCAVVDVCGRVFAPVPVGAEHGACGRRAVVDVVATWVGGCDDEC